VIGFGSTSPFPFDLGGGRSVVEDEHEALLRRLADIFDTEQYSDAWIETYAEAVALAIVWAANARLRNMHVPARMLDALRDWEQATGILPTESATDGARRAAVAAKLRGLPGNAMGDIEAMANALLGVWFEAVHVVSPANTISYWPGVNPGPPGFEWTSNRAIVAVQMSRAGLDDAAFAALRSRLVVALDALLPSWMRFVIGTGTSFVANIGIVGETLL
jgi:hypothetical protein